MEEERKNKNSGSYELNNDIKVEFGNINNSIVADTDKNLITFVPLSENSISFSDKENKFNKFYNLSFKRPKTINRYLI